MPIIEGALLRGAVERNPSSRLFRVNPATDDAQDAIDACAEDNGDIVVIGPGSHNRTSALLFNKQGITVVAAMLGYPPEVQGESFTVNAAAGYDDGPAAIVTKPCRIVGLGFAGRELAGESLLIDCGGAGGFEGGFTSLEHCRFSCWYGAIAAGLRMKGGALNHVVGSSFDGLFAGFGTGAIVMENVDAFAPAYTRVIGNRFSGVGAGKHAIVHAVGSVPVDVLYADNDLLPGFLGNQGKFLDNNNVASTGLATRNGLGGLTNKAGAFENMTNSTIRATGNFIAEDA